MATSCLQVKHRHKQQLDAEPWVRCSPGAGGPCFPPAEKLFISLFFYYYFLSWTRRVKSDILSRAGPQPLLLCNCCSGGTGPARSRPPPSFRAEGFFPHHPPPSGSGVCACTDGLLPPPPPHSPSKEPGPRAFCTFQGGEHRPRLASPITISPNWVLSYLHIWLLWDHRLGEGGGQPPATQQPPRLVPVPLLLWKAWAPKVLYVFIVTLYGYVK